MEEGLGLVVEDERVVAEEDDAVALEAEDGDGEAGLIHNDEVEVLGRPEQQVHRVQENSYVSAKQPQPTQNRPRELRPPHALELVPLRPPALRRPLLALPAEEAALRVEVRAEVRHAVVPLLEGLADIQHVLLLVEGAALARRPEVGVEDRHPERFLRLILIVERRIVLLLGEVV